MVVRLTNLTKHDIYIAESRSSNIVDDSGMTWKRREVSGLTVFTSGAENFRADSGFSPDRYLSLMTPGQSQPVNYTFKPKGKAGGAKTLSFSTTIYLKVPTNAGDDEWRYVPVGVGISGIKIK